MAKKVKLTRWDTAETLETEDDIAGYLAEAFQDGDIELIRHALNDSIRARNMTEIAKNMGISRKALFKMLSENENLDLLNVNKLLSVIGISLSVVSKEFSDPIK